jgi:hypothetical protein
MLPITGPAVRMPPGTGKGKALFLTLRQRSIAGLMPSMAMKDQGETFIYEWVIPTFMAKGAGKRKKGGKSKGKDKSSKKGDKPKKQQMTQKPHRYSPIRTSHHDSSMKEVSAKRAFLTSVLLFSIILAPILGIVLYFARDVSSLEAFFSNREEAFIAGMAIGVAFAFVISILFTRKAIAQPS